MKSHQKNIESGVQDGYFALVDISGYTEYVTTIELEHSRGVLSEITQLMIETLRAPFKFVELEGDAVFVHAPAADVDDAERLVEIIESSYVAFVLLREQMVANTTCTCAACIAIKNLDLKCVAHFGRYAPENTPSGVKLVGSDVVLVHRMLKNTVIESTGIRAYAFLTEAFTAKATSALPHLGSPTHAESYENLGTIHGCVLDLREAVEQYTGNKRYFVTSEEADIEVVTDLPVPKSVAWAFHIDPSRRMAWQTDTTSIKNSPNQQGRTGVGTESYCDHGNYRLNHRFVDWSPFDYMTLDSVSTGPSLKKPPPCLVTFVFEETSGESCRTTFRIRTHDKRLVMRFLMTLAKPIVYREWRAHYDRLRALLNNGAASE